MNASSVGAKRGQGGLGRASPGFIEKSAHFGAFWHIFMQFNSLSESFIFSTGKVIKF